MIADWEKFNLMDKQNEEKPFADILQAILHDEPVPVHYLYRLSDMSDADSNAFFDGWRTIEEERRRIITRHLADISEENFMVDFSPLFSDGLNDDSEEVRLASVDGLWDSSDRKFVPILLNMMKHDRSEKVRAAATAALAHYVLMAEWGELPERVAKPIVEALLQVYDDEETAVIVRRAAVESLSGSSNERVANIIREAYESEDLQMQLSAVFGMGNSADPKWLPTILTEMENPNDEMRAEAARAAGSIGRSDAVNELIELTDDEELQVQLAAVAALGQIGGDVAQQVLNSILEDEEREELHDIAEQALEEMVWTSGDLNFMDLDFDDDGEVDAF